MMRKRSMVTQEELVNVHHSFVMKHISDSDGDGLVVTGTFVQYVFCSNEDLIESENNKNEKEEDGSDIKGVHFEYRFNDTSAEDEKYFVQYQGVEIQEHTDMGKLFKHSYYIKIPLALDVKLDCFPFRVISASLLVELTTFTTDDKKLRVRPDLMVHKRDKTNMFSIQPDLWREDSRSPMQQANDIMDQSENYDLVSPFPRVSYIYNSQKNYCPKFRVQFLMVQNGTKKLLEILVPMVLIAALNTFHVMGGEVTDIPDYTGNSANFALSVLIFLPTISSGTGHIQTLWRASNMYIITIILALALSSVPYEWVGFNHIASAGMILYWVSFLFPIINCLRYVRFVRHAKFHKAGAGMHFWASDDYSDSRNDPYDETQYDAKSSFVKVSEIVNDSDEQGLQLKAMDFRIRTVNKSQILEFASMEEIKARLIEEVMPLHIQKSDEEVMFI